MKKITYLFVLMTLVVLLIACSKENTDLPDVETRIVRDVRGEVEIPANPQRIADLSGNSDILALLGFNVVGTANSDAYDYTKLPSYLEAVLGDAKILGYSYQDTMDIENIISVNPDLIIISTIQEKMYDTLKQIAPTIMIQLEALDWKEDIKTVANLLDKNEEAIEWISNYEEKATLAGTEIKTDLGEDTSYLSFLDSSGQFFIFSGAGFGNVLYEDLGLKIPTGMPVQENVSLPVVTYEGLAAINADVMFVIATDADYDELQKDAIYNNLPAVKNQKVVVLKASPYFNQGYSPIGRLLLLDEIPVMLNDLNQ